MDANNTQETTTMTTALATLDPDTDTQTGPTPGAKVAAKTICLILKIGRFGNSRKASLVPVTVDADKALLTLSKQLLDSPELVAITKFDSALTASIRKLAYT